MSQSNSFFPHFQVYCLGTILSMQISFVGFQPVQSSEHMAVSFIQRSDINSKSLNVQCVCPTSSTLFFYIFYYFILTTSLFHIVPHLIIKLFHSPTAAQLNHPFPPLPSVPPQPYSPRILPPTPYPLSPTFVIWYLCISANLIIFYTF